MVLTSYFSLGLQISNSIWNFCFPHNGIITKNEFLSFLIEKVLFFSFISVGRCTASFCNLFVTIIFISLEKPYFRSFFVLCVWYSVWTNEHDFNQQWNECMWSRCKYSRMKGIYISFKFFANSIKINYLSPRHKNPELFSFCSINSFFCLATDIIINEYLQLLCKYFR